MLLVSDDFILDLESMNHKLTNTMIHYAMTLHKIGLIGTHGFQAYLP